MQLFWHYLILLDFLYFHFIKEYWQLYANEFDNDCKCVKNSLNTANLRIKMFAFLEADGWRDIWYYLWHMVLFDVLTLLYLFVLIHVLACIWFISPYIIYNLNVYFCGTFSILFKIQLIFLPWLFPNLIKLLRFFLL